MTKHDNTSQSALMILSPVVKVPDVYGNALHLDLSYHVLRTHITWHIHHIVAPILFTSIGGQGRRNIARIANDQKVHI